MTEQELNVFLDLEWNCAAFTPDTEHISAPLSPKQWARIISRHPELQEFCPFSEFTPDEWLIVLEKQQSLAWRCTCWRDFTPYQWQNLLRHQPTLLHYCEIPDHPAVRSGLRCITAKSRIIQLYGAGYWQVAGVMQGISTRMTSRLGTGSGSSSIPHGFGLTAPVRRSSQNRCGGASCTALPTCCQTAPTLTSSAMRTGAGSTSFRS